MASGRAGAVVRLARRDRAGLARCPALPGGVRPGGAGRDDPAQRDDRRGHRADAPVRRRRPRRAAQPPAGLAAGHAGRVADRGHPRAGRRRPWPSVAATLSEIADGEDQAARAAGITLVGDTAIAACCPPLDGAALAALAPPYADPGGLTAEQITGLSRAFAADADMLQERLGSLSGLAGMLGLRPPVTFSDAADLLAIADLAGGPTGPSAGGYPSRATRRPARPGAPSTMPTVSSPAAEADASAYYTPEALHARCARAWRTGFRRRASRPGQAVRGVPDGQEDRRRLHPGRHRQGNRLSAAPARRCLAAAPRRRSPPPRPASPRCSAATTRARPPTSTGSAARSRTPPTPCTGPTGRTSGRRPPRSAADAPAEPGDHRHRGRVAPGPGRLAGGPGRAGPPPPAARNC